MLAGKGESMTYPHITIDYGHGGLIEAEYQTPGKRYVHETDSGPVIVFEGVQNRVIAAGLISYMLANGRKVFDCVAGKWWDHAPKWHELDQRDVSLSARTRNANTPNARNGLLISIHSNATGNDHQGKGTTASGWELYTSRGETRSDAAARHFAGILAKYTKTVRGIHEAGFAMVTQTKGSAVLVEHGYHTTRKDAELIVFNADSIAHVYWLALADLIGCSNAKP